jgi:hypothetical protein
MYLGIYVKKALARKIFVFPNFIGALALGGPSPGLKRRLLVGDYFKSR